jgi:hypothetical protein
MAEIAAAPESLSTEISQEALKASSDDAAVLQSTVIVHPATTYIPATTAYTYIPA